MFFHYYFQYILAASIPEENAVELALTGVSILTSSLLSLALVGLYNSQRNILSSQKDLAKAEHTPILRVDSINAAEFKPTGAQDQGDWLEITLSNVGNEVATEIEVEFLISYEDKENSGYEVNSSRYPLNRIDQPQQFNARTGEALPAGEQDVDYYSIVQFEVSGWGENPEDEQNRAFINALDGLEEVDTVNFGVKLHYQSPAGEDYDIVLDPAYEISWTDTPPSFKNALESADKQEMTF
ncbi:hypothetical protein GCM10009020_05580 [Natronoarchaeum mannanilyticum]|uniref:Uncharacterized protein n=2 Tax=Natronoarchaeum mannanilyticum TaxID=926360 RepID=A0AAV3T6M9_9EURY